MKCPTCRGRLKRGTAPFHVDRKGCHVQWDAIPAWVCAQCGEAVFEESAVATIEEALKGLDRRPRRLGRSPVA